MKYLLKGGFVVDPFSKVVKKLDLLWEGAKITEIGEQLDVPGAKELLLEECFIFPGFVDMHCHLREPGEELKETILTGTRAAAKGGFTAVACMGNTKPPADSSAVISLIKEKASQASFPVYPIGCATKGRAGGEPSEIGELVDAGAVALSDDGSSIMSSEVLRRVMEYAKMFDIPVLSHCEDTFLSDEGVMYEGFYSTQLGLKGIPAAAEDVQVAGLLCFVKDRKGLVP
jgi:dihydroorotase